MKVLIAIYIIAFTAGTYAYRIENKTDIKVDYSIIDYYMHYAMLQCENSSEIEIQPVSDDVREDWRCATNVLDEINFNKLFDSELISDDIDKITAVINDTCLKAQELFICADNLKKHLPECLDTSVITHVEAILNVTKRITEYVCHNDGERVITFIKEDGVECFEENQSEILECFNDVSKMFVECSEIESTESLEFNQDRQFNMNVSKGLCDMIDHHHQCVTEIINKCKKPQIYDVLNGLHLTIKEGISCDTLFSIRRFACTITDLFSIAIELFFKALGLAIHQIFQSLTGKLCVQQCAQ